MADGGDGVGVGRAVIGDIERVVAAVAGGGANHPVVGLRAVVKHPVGALCRGVKAAAIGERVDGLAGKRAGGGLRISAGVVRATDGGDADGVESVERKVGDGVEGVGDAGNHAVADEDNPFRLIVSSSPMEGDIFSGNAVDGQLCGLQAGRRGGDVDIGNHR